jgi:lactoylglutathione lyase
MKLGYTIIYVSDVSGTIDFYERAFGLKLRFAHENLYAEMDTGDTLLAFASEEMSKANGLQIRPNRPTELTAGFEIAFVTADPEAAFAKAVAAGAIEVVAPRQKPWGQVVGYVRDLNGCLVEIGSPIGDNAQ